MSLKVHKLPTFDNTYTVCGRDSMGENWCSVLWTIQWKYVTCKSCRKKKR